jgi:hypothetical protein
MDGNNFQHKRVEKAVPERSVKSRLSPYAEPNLTRLKHLDTRNVI